MEKCNLGFLLIAICLLSTFVVAQTWFFPATPDFVINSTSQFNTTTKTNVTTSWDRFNQSANTLEMDMPYAINDSNLVDYLRFSEDAGGINTALIDETNTSTSRWKTGAIAPHWNSTGVFGGGYNFTREHNDVINMTGKPSYTTLGSISLWVNQPAYASGSYYNVFGFGCVGTSSLMRLKIFGNASGYGYVHFDTRSAVYTCVESSSSTTSELAPNTWNHVVVTSTGATWNIYVNGVDVTKVTCGTNSGDWFGDLASCGATATYTSIGGWYYYSPSGWQTAAAANGTIDEVKIYNDTLSATEVATLYNNGKQYIDTTLTTPVSNWTSASQTITSGYYLKNFTINATGLSATSYITKVEILNSTGTVKYSNTTDIIADGLITYWNLTSGAKGWRDINSTEAFNVSLTLASNGATTPLIYDISGYWNDTYDLPVVPPPVITPSIPLNTSYCLDSLWFNITLDKLDVDVSWAGFSLDGDINTTMTNSTGNWNYQYNVGWNCTDNTHNVTFYANDTLGNMVASSTTVFWVCCCGGGTTDDTTNDAIIIVIFIIASVFAYLYYNTSESEEFFGTIRVFYRNMCVAMIVVGLYMLYRISSDVGIGADIITGTNSYMLIIFTIFMFFLILDVLYLVLKAIEFWYPKERSFKNGS